MKNTLSSINKGEFYGKEHAILENIFSMYKASELATKISFNEYLDCLLRLDSARHNHEVHNFFKAEHSMNEHFSLGSLEDEEEI